MAWGHKHYQRKSADCKAQISKVFFSLAELICALQIAEPSKLSIVFITSSQLTHNLFF